MCLRTFLFLLYSLLSNVSGISQTTLTGKVQDESGKPLAEASVFLASTSFGSVANDKGQFSLSGMAPGRYDLVVSCMGYQTFSQSIDTRQITTPLSVVLKAKADELENVTIGPGEEATWAKWGQFFLENFIGTMPGSQDCKIENQADIRFRHFPKQKLLRATSPKPLIIINKALGYSITYQLEYFQYDFDSRIVYYLGYPLFRQMQPKNERMQKKWAENRMDAYLGSQMHFLRSIYRNTALEEGFEMRRLVKTPNLEKERVKKLMFSQIQSEGNLQISLSGSAGPVITSANRDSANYYQQVMRQPDLMDILYSPILPGDSVAFEVNPHTAGLEFTDYLHITYVKEKEHPDYVQAQMRQSQKPGYQISILKMNEARTLEIDQQGMVNDPLIVLITGYWGWNDKMATMLPYDYKVPKR